ncbi:MAG: DNA cytosine methyltransferase [Candidatus Margulisiibacteriota bacterium]
MLNKQKKNSRLSPKAISLFAGCGGLDLGFTQEGFSVLWANDFNHWACETYKINFGNHIVEGDIADIKTKDIPDCDLILGGFPCQDFSMLWKRGGINTERGNLYRHYVRMVDAKRPQMFIAENVKGILTANDGKAVEQIVGDFDKVGYRVKVNRINFADYGAPQQRHRVLIVGVRKNIRIDFEMPLPTHSPDNYMSSKKALAGVEKVSHNNEHQNIANKTRKMLELIPPGGNFTSIPKSSPYYVKGMISHVYRRLHPDEPSTTIIAGGGGGTWGYHYAEPRPLTNRERARLFGYPDDFIFAGSITEVRRQIGNSVPPLGIRPIAKAVYEFFRKLK